MDKKTCFVVMGFGWMIESTETQLASLRGLLHAAVKGVPLQAPTPS